MVTLVIMWAPLDIGIYGMNKGQNNTLIFQVPTVFCPLANLPTLFLAFIGMEIKKRKASRR